MGLDFGGCLVFLALLPLDAEREGVFVKMLSFLFEKIFCPHTTLIQCGTDFLC